MVQLSFKKRILFQKQLNMHLSNVQYLLGMWIVIDVGPGINLICFISRCIWGGGTKERAVAWSLVRL